MSLLLCCSSPRPSRPRWRSAGRRRSTTHRLLAGAQRRMAAERLSCLARNGRSPGEESLTAAVAAQAIEAEPSFGQIKPSEAAWLARSTALRRSGGYRMTHTRRHTRRAKEKKPWRTDRGRTMSRPGSTASAGRSCRIQWRRRLSRIEALQRLRDGHALAIRGRLGNRH
jgi:hypothetical protein